MKTQYPRTLLELLCALGRVCLVVCWDARNSDARRKFAAPRGITNADPVILSADGSTEPLQAASVRIE